MVRLHGVFLIAAAAQLAVPVQAQAEPSVALVKGPQAEVTSLDLRASSHRLPKASRDAIMSRPDTVQRQAEDLYIRRLLAREAEHDKLNEDPIAATLIRQSRERILSEARLVEIDLAALPAPEKITATAQELYRANPERFQQPAQTRARHILISRGPDGSGKETAEKLAQLLKAGERFETVAEKHSTDLASALQGGDLGWFTKGQMINEFEVAVDALQNPGDVSGVVETQFGFHIIRLEGRREAGLRSFDEVRESLEREVRAKIQAAAREAKVRQLLEGAKADPAAIETFTRQYRNP